MIAVEVSKHADKFNCKTCTHKHCDTTGERPDSQGRAPFPMWKIGGVGELITCPLPMITRRSYKLLELHGDYKDRVMPYAGGSLDQPNLLIEAVRLIDRLAAER